MEEYSMDTGYTGSSLIFGNNLIASVTSESAIQL